MTKEPQTSISSRNGAATSIESSPSATDTSEWESRMAKLVGLEEEPTPLNSQTQETQQTNADKQPTDPNSARTKQALSANPFAKAGLVGATTLAVVMFAGVVLSQIMSGGGKPQVKKNVTIKPRSQPEAPPRLQQLETEVETLKTKLALEKQAEAVKTAQQQLRRIKPKSEAPNKPSPPKAPTPVKNISPPQVITRVVQEPQPIEAPQIQPAPPPAPPPEPDPIQEWQRLAKLGSYGRVTQDISKQSTSKIPSPPKKPSTLLNKPKPELKQKPSPPIASQRRQRNGKSTFIGSSAKAVVATAIFGESTKLPGKNNRNLPNRKSNIRPNSKPNVQPNSKQDDNVFVVRLREPLKTRKGEIVVPKGSEIITKISSISQSGLVELNVTKVLLKQKDGLIERSVTPNALKIRGSKGKPLIASNYTGKNSSIARMDAELFVLGGLGKASELINNSDSTTTTTSTSTVVTTDDDTNILAGFLEGGMDTVVPQMTRRNQQKISQMMRKNNVWFIKAGEKVEVYVNKEIQF